MKLGNHTIVIETNKQEHTNPNRRIEINYHRGKALIGKNEEAAIHIQGKNGALLIFIKKVERKIGQLTPQNLLLIPLSQEKKFQNKEYDNY